MNTCSTCGKIEYFHCVSNQCDNCYGETQYELCKQSCDSDSKYIRKGFLIANIFKFGGIIFIVIGVGIAVIALLEG